MSAPSENSFPLGYYPYVFVAYFQGDNNGSAQMKWVEKLDGIYGYPVYVGNGIGSVASENLLKVDKLKAGESKVVVQCVLCYDKSGGWGRRFSDGTPCKNVPPRKAFNFLFFDPVGGGTSGGGFFPGTVFFTPKAGFPTTAP